jgi:hypothetical protein
MKAVTSLTTVAAVFGLIGLWAVRTGAARLIDAGASWLPHGRPGNGAAGED